MANAEEVADFQDREDQSRLQAAYQDLSAAQDRLDIVKELIALRKRNRFLEAEYEKQVQAGHDRLASDLTLFYQLASTEKLK